MIIIGTNAYRWLLLRVIITATVVINLTINKNVRNIVFYTCPSTSMKTN
jgi:hypothetical protein